MFAIFRDDQVMQVELKSDIPEDGKHIMPKRVGCERILIDGAWFLKF
jgi:hypothetical protein